MDVSPLFAAIGGWPALLQVFTIIVLCVIFWDPIAAKVFSYSKEKREDGLSEEDVSKQLLAAMGQLSGYFNHDTTEMYREMTSVLKSIQIGIDSINRKHEEWDKYGINTRECVEHK